MFVSAPVTKLLVQYVEALNSNAYVISVPVGCFMRYPLSSKESFDGYMSQV